MLRHKDTNGAKFLRVITEEFLCSISSYSAAGNRQVNLTNTNSNPTGTLTGTTSTNSKSHHEKLQQLWEKIGKPLIS